MVLLLQRAAQVVPPRRVVRIPRDTLAVLLDRSIELAARGQRVAEIAEAGREIRLQFQRATEGLDRFVDATGGLQHDAEVVVRLGGMRLLRDRPAIRSLRLRQLSRRSLRLAEVVPHPLDARLERGSPPDQLDGCIGATDGIRQDPKHVQRLGLIGNRIKDLPVQLLCLLQAPRQMMLDGGSIGFIESHVELEAHRRLELVPALVDRVARRALETVQ
jgi:hypothetical protein